MSRATTTPYFYVMSDNTKAHVNPSSEPIGIPLVFVSPFGQEIPFVNSRSTVLTLEQQEAAVAASLSRIRS